MQACPRGPQATTASLAPSRRRWDRRWLSAGCTRDRPVGAASPTLWKSLMVEFTIFGPAGCDSWSFVGFRNSSEQNACYDGPGPSSLSSVA